MKSRNWCVAAAALALLFSCATCAQVVTTRAPVALTDAQQARYMALLPGLRCMQCQNESLESSQAPLAADMRYKIRQLIASGESDAQIKQYLVDRYGQYVLYKPRFEPLTWLLWLGPALFLLIALGVCWRLLASHKPGKVTSERLDREALKRLLGDDP